MLFELAPLEQVLEDHAEWADEIIYRFVDDFSPIVGEAGLSTADAHEVFRETKRWLWLCAYRKTQFEQGQVGSALIPLASEALIIDRMWHTFLLFTKEYADFCKRHFGFFIHHHPMPRTQKQRATQERRRDPEAFKTKQIDELRAVYGYIHDVLGRETLLRWFEEFPRKYASLSS